MWMTPPRCSELACIPQDFCGDLAFLGACSSGLLPVPSTAAPPHTSPSGSALLVLEPGLCGEHFAQLVSAHVTQAPGRGPVVQWIEWKCREGCDTQLQCGGSRAQTWARLAPESAPSLEFISTSRKDLGPCGCSVKLNLNSRASGISSWPWAKCFTAILPPFADENTEAKNREVESLAQVCTAGKWWGHDSGPRCLL